MRIEHYVNDNGRRYADLSDLDRLAYEYPMRYVVRFTRMTLGRQRTVTRTSESKFKTLGDARERCKQWIAVE
jgi:hypothetical protein